LWQYLFTFGLGIELAHNREAIVSSDKKDLQATARNLVALAILACDDNVDGQAAENPRERPSNLLDRDPVKMEKFIGWLNVSAGLSLQMHDRFNRLSNEDFVGLVYRHLLLNPEQQINPAPLSEIQWAADHNIVVGGKPVVAPERVLPNQP
jgi:hypothetical protein